MKKYRAEKLLLTGEYYQGAIDCEEFNDIGKLRYACCTWLIESPECVARVFTRTGRVYAAKLIDRGEGPTVRFEQIHSDGVPLSDAIAREDRRQRRYVELIDREEKRRRRKHGEQKWREDQARKEKHSTIGQNRPVVCIDNLRPFKGASDAARWVGVTQESLAAALKRGNRSGRLRWEYADRILQELENARDHVTAAHLPDARWLGEAQADPAKRAALVKAAKHALLLR